MIIILATSLFMICCGGSSGSNDGPRPQPKPDSELDTACPKGQKKDGFGICLPVEDTRICPPSQVFDPDSGRCVSKDQDRPCPFGETRNENGLCERPDVPTAEPKASFVWTHFRDVVATDGVYQLGYMTLSALAEDDDVSDRKIEVKGETCEGAFTWSPNGKNSLQFSSAKDGDQMCQVTLEARTKKQLILKTKTFPVTIKKRKLTVDWDPSRTTLAFAGPRAYLGTFRMVSNSQFPIKRTQAVVTDTCKFELENDNLYGQYTGADQTTVCRTTVSFSTEDGKLSVTKQADIKVEKAQLELFLSMNQQPAEVPYGPSYWSVVNAVVTTNMASDQYQLRFVSDNSGTPNSPLCQEAKGLFQGHSLALSLNRIPDGSVPQDLSCRFGIEVASRADAGLRAVKSFVVLFRQAKTNFRIETRTASIFNGKIPRAITTIVFETEEAGVTVKQVNASSDNCNYLTFQTQSSTDDNALGRWKLQAASRAAMEVPEQTGRLLLASRANQDLSCSYSLRASLPGQFFAKAELPLTIHFVKRPPPVPSAVQYALQVQTLTSSLTSGQGEVAFAKLNLLDAQNRSYAIKNEQVFVTFNPECQTRLDQASFYASTQTLSLKTDQVISQALNCTAVFELRDFDPSRSNEVLTSQPYAFKILPKPQPKIAVYNCPPNASNYAVQIWLDLEKGKVSNASILDARTSDSGLTHSIGLVTDLGINMDSTNDRLKRFDICTPGVTFSCPNSIASNLKPYVEFDLDADLVTMEAFANFDIRLLPQMSWTLSECKVFRI